MQELKVQFAGLMVIRKFHEKNEEEQIGMCV
jgi:glycine cleavage system protein P-like pyridoxal-binding family